MRQRLMKDGAEEDSLPYGYRVVRGLVLRVDTPFRCLVSAAGHHQSTQHDTVEPGVGDVMRSIIKVAKEKVAKDRRAHLTDDELYDTLQQMGMERGNDSLLAKKSSDDTLPMSPDEAAKLQAKTVCNASLCHVSQQHTWVGK